MPTATALHPLFATRVTGIDIGQALSASDAAWLRDALDHWSVLVLSAPPFANATERRRMVRTTVQCPPAVA